MFMHPKCPEVFGIFVDFFTNAQSNQIWDIMYLIGYRDRKKTQPMLCL